METGRTFDTRQDRPDGGADDWWGALRILVVDEEETFRRALSQLLADAGFLVTTAASGDEALELFRRDPFPLVITDIVMTGMSGIDFLQKIKGRYRDTEAIITTGCATLETAIPALRLGAHDYLTKSSESVDLIVPTVRRIAEKIQFAQEQRKVIEHLEQKNGELEFCNRTLSNAAALDADSGLYNRQFFHDALTLELSRSVHHERSFSIVFVEVSCREQHTTGQGTCVVTERFRAVAQIVRKRLRRSDLLAMWDKSTLAILLPETPRSGACTVTDSLRRLVQDYLHPAGALESVGDDGISVGIAAYPEDGTDGSQLIQLANQAL